MLGFWIGFLAGLVIGLVTGGILLEKVIWRQPSRMLSRFLAFVDTVLRELEIWRK